MGRDVRAVLALGCPSRLKKKIRPATRRSYRYHCDTYLLPVWQHIKAKDVTSKEVHKVLDAIRAKGHDVLANRVRATISVISNHGFEREVIDVNPVARVSKTGETSRKVVLTPEEVRNAWSLGNAARLMLLTATRGDEVKKMRWSEVEGDVWTIPGDRADGTGAKNHEDHRVPLVAEAKAIFGLDREVEP